MQSIEKKTKAHLGVMIVCHVLFTLALLLTHKLAQQVSSTKILSADMSAYMLGDKSA